MKKLINYFFYAVLAMTIAACSNEIENKVSIDYEIIVDGVATRSSEAGTVTGGGLYNHGQSCTVEAKANEGYELLSFEDVEKDYADQSKYTFPVPGNMKFTAKFQSIKNVVITITDKTYSYGDSNNSRIDVYRTFTATNCSNASILSWENLSGTGYAFTLQNGETNHWIEYHRQEDPSQNAEMGGGVIYEESTYYRVHSVIVDGVTVLDKVEYSALSQTLTIGNVKYTITYSDTFINSEPK